MNRSRLVGFLSLVLILCLLVPALLLAHSGQQPAPAEKKKPRKVWTNEDFASGEQPAAEEKKPEGEAAPAAAPTQAELLFAELDAAKQELAQAGETLALYQQQLVNIQQRRSDATSDYDRDMYDRAIPAAESEIAATEASIKELEARVAELETLTKGMKRPKPRPPQEKPAAEEPAAPPPNLVSPGAGPTPTKEPPPPPPPSA